MTTINLFQKLRAAKVRNEFLENIIYLLTTESNKNLSLNMIHEIESIICSKDGRFVIEKGYHPSEVAKKTFQKNLKKYDEKIVKNEN